MPKGEGSKSKAPAKAAGIASLTERSSRLQRKEDQPKPHGLQAARPGGKRALGRNADRRLAKPVGLPSFNAGEEQEKPRKLQDAMPGVGRTSSDCKVSRVERTLGYNTEGRTANVRPPRLQSLGDDSHLPAVKLERGAKAHTLGCKTESDKLRVAPSRPQCRARR